MAAEKAAVPVRTQVASEASEPAVEPVKDRQYVEEDESSNQENHRHVEHLSLLVPKPEARSRMKEFQGTPPVRYYCNGTALGHQALSPNLLGRISLIDEKDKDILAAMMGAGRATFGEIGNQVGLAASSVHDRVRKLEQRGVIKGYGPHLDPTKLDLKMLAFVRVVTNRTCRALSQDLQGWQEIEELHAVAGEECVLLKVRAADPEQMEDFLDRLRSVPGVERTQSTIVLRTLWEHPAGTTRRA
jgi:Lrp/AsnC family leucine-responsive transcriptional regulator